MQRTRQRVVLVVFAVVAGLALGLGIDVVRSGGPGPWLARHRLPPPYVASGTNVEIDGGRSLYLDCRGTGTPTVILESGMGDGAGGWASVLDDLAAVTRTCAYDRAGRGSSPPAGHRTLADAATDLRALLDAAGESGPFVVIGHSLGGDYVRVFAARYRDEISAVGLVDSFNPDLQAGWVHPLLGDLRPEYEAGLQRLRDLVAGVEDLDWAASEAQLVASDLSGLPIEVLRAPRFEPRLDEAANAAVAEAWIAAYDSLSPGKVRHETAWGAGHLVQIDRPDLVVDMVHRLVETDDP
jgi:pimeloyl-ACP methyl ester carboxylesterase